MDPAQIDFHRLGDEDRRGREQAEHNRLSTIIAIVALSISFFSALFTGWYAWEERQLRLEAKDTAIQSLQASQRAFLSVESPQLIQEGETPKITFLVRASGQSPAKDIKVSSNCYQLKTAYSLVEEPKADPSQIYGTGVMAPGSSFPYRCRVLFSPPLQQTDVAIVGKLFYTDVFAHTHHTTFCYRTTVGIVPFEPCDKFNDAD